MPYNGYDGANALYSWNISRKFGAKYLSCLPPWLIFCYIGCRHMYTVYRRTILPRWWKRTSPLPSWHILPYS